MYSLKREAIQHQMYPAALPDSGAGPEFFELVRSYGRNSEVWLVLRMALKSNPFVLLTHGANRAGSLLRTGRMSLKQERIKRIQELQRELARPRRFRNERQRCLSNRVTCISPAAR